MLKITKNADGYRAEWIVNGEVVKWIDALESKFTDEDPAGRLECAVPYGLKAITFHPSNQIDFGSAKRPVAQIKKVLASL